MQIYKRQKFDLQNFWASQVQAPRYGPIKSYSKILVPKNFLLTILAKNILFPPARILNSWILVQIFFLAFFGPRFFFLKN